MGQWAGDGPFLDHDLHEIINKVKNEKKTNKQMDVWRFVSELTTTAKYSMNKKARLLVYPRKPVRTRERSIKKQPNKKKINNTLEDRLTYQF